MTAPFPISKLYPSEFPERLRQISDPPEILYLRGKLPADDFKWLTVVGSRKYSGYGKEVCEKLISGLRGYPVVIVSGLALGIDGIAHRTALSVGLPTVAIPGSGLGPDALYPRSHALLAEKIVSSGGALLSEFEPDFRATAWSFPQRNRIMAGLSDAVLVIEAELRSGTLITSKFATEYNRDVFTVPGSIFSSLSGGPHMLIRLGATPITSSAELLEALGFSPTNPSTLNPVPSPDCSPDELLILELLAAPISREELIATIPFPIHKTNALLGTLEIKGLIKESMGEVRRA